MRRLGIGLLVVVAEIAGRFYLVAARMLFVVLLCCIEQHCLHDVRRSDFFFGIVA